MSKIPKVKKDVMKFYKQIGDDFQDSCVDILFHDIVNSNNLSQQIVDNLARAFSLRLSEAMYLKKILKQSQVILVLNKNKKSENML